MSLPGYAEYKDSGVEWLGQVPKHWGITRLKHQLRLLTEKTDSRLNTIALENIESWSGNFIATTSQFEGDGVAFKSGDILFGKLRPYLAKVYLANGEGEAVGDFHVLRPESVMTGKFAQYQILNRNFIDIIDGFTFGSKMPRASWEALGGMPFVAPPKDEQANITAFLDRETGKIAALIAEQEQLLNLLAEKRQATISHAVTRGLHPDAPMKDSGVAWLGQVPAHWNVYPLKRELTFLTSGSRGWAEHYADEGALFIRIGNLTRNSIHLDLNDIQRVAVPEGTEGQRTKVQTGDLLFSITAYLGSVAVAPDNLEDAFVSQHVALARLALGHILPNWVAYVALSWVGKTYLETQGYGGTKVQLSLEDVANLLLTVPPFGEQSAIVAFLEQELARLDALTAEAERAIALLKERRSALIAAAVTGRIDVRQAGAGTS